MTKHRQVVKEMRAQQWRLRGEGVGGGWPAECPGCQPAARGETAPFDPAPFGLRSHAAPGPFQFGSAQEEWRGVRLRTLWATEHGDARRLVCKCNPIGAGQIFIAHIFSIYNNNNNIYNVMYFQVRQKKCRGMVWISSARSTNACCLCVSIPRQSITVTCSLVLA